MTVSVVRTPRRRRGRGALALIAGLLVASGLFRSGDEAGLAIAAAGDAAASAFAQDEPEDGTCLQTGDSAAMIEALHARETRLAAREAALADRQQALIAAEAAIDSRLAELAAAEAALTATLALASNAAEQDLTGLTAVYENMKPREAADLFAEMDPVFAAGFLGRMRADAAAAILAGLEPPKAYAISVALAGRNVAVPTE